MREDIFPLLPSTHPFPFPCSISFLNDDRFQQSPSSSLQSDPELRLPSPLVKRPHFFFSQCRLGSGVTREAFIPSHSLLTRPPADLPDRSASTTNSVSPSRFKRVSSSQIPKRFPLSFFLGFGRSTIAKQLMRPLFSPYTPHLTLFGDDMLSRITFRPERGRLHDFSAELMESFRLSK